MNGPVRDFERSSASHNVLQLGLSQHSGIIQWVEPVEVWGSFRAARKCRPSNRLSGKLSNGSLLLKVHIMALIQLGHII